MSSSVFFQGIAGAEGPAGKDGLVGDRVRFNTWCFCVVVCHLWQV